MFKMSLLIMSTGNKTYWKGIEQLKNDPSFVKNAHNEFPEFLPIKGSSNNSRRDFLKMMGFGIAAVSTVACEAPVKYAIPHVDKPVDLDPSLANYYASTYTMGSDYCSVVVKTREGRPIKIDGNKFSKVSVGCTSSQVESSVLSLYDKQRLVSPMLDNKETTWSELDKHVKRKLSSETSRKKYIVSHSINSPSTLDVIKLFCERHDAVHIQYDNISYNGMLDANFEHYGKRKLPSYDFSKADVIVSFGYDFLGGSFNHNLFNKQFTERRVVDRDNREMSRLYTFEPNLSLTGANSDNRIPTKSSLYPIYLSELWNILSLKIGKNVSAKYKSPIIKYDSSKKSLINLEILEKVAEDLVENIGRSLIVSDSNNKSVQLLVNLINEQLGNYGRTINVNNSYNIRNGDDKLFNQFEKELLQGDISTLIFLNCNPVYEILKLS